VDANPWEAARIECVSDQPNEQGVGSSARGEKAWQEALERVAERNRAVRKEGKRLREADERERDGARHAAERLRMSELVAKSDGRSSSGR
jgi:hypothetical protein